jgi:hypothetical protein
LETNLIHEMARLGLGALGMALTVVISIYGPRILRAFEARLGIDIPDPIAHQAERLALDAIAFAEERGRALANHAGRKLLAGEKLDLAAKYFREHAGDQVLELVRGHVADWIESKLGHLRGEITVDRSGIVSTLDRSPPHIGTASLSAS